jgi:integrase
MRKYGHGSVYRRKDGRWVAQVWIGGKPIYGYAKTQRDAERLRWQLVNARERHQELTHPTRSPTSLTVGELAEDWLAAADLKPVTEESYRRILNRYVLPVLGPMTLVEVTPADVAKVVARARAGMSARTAQYAYGVTRRLLQVAVEWELLDRNPAARVKRPHAESRDRPVWSIEQSASFIRSCQRSTGPWDTLFLVGLLSGLRVGELLGLEWGDLDWERGVVSVRRSLVQLDGSVFRIQDPKSRISRRTIALPGAALEALQNLREQAGAQFAVFRRSDGMPPSRSTLRSALIAACRRAEVPYIGMHGLRHQHVSLLAHAGVPVKVAQQRVGHSTSMLTLDIYTHVLGNNDTQAAVALSSLVVSRVGEQHGTPSRRKTIRQ